ncbi:MAG: methyltransferase domain-containing protein [Pseudomonadota bacterium]
MVALKQQKTGSSPVAPSLKTALTPHEAFAPGSNRQSTLFKKAETNPLLKDVPKAVIRQAWFTMAHLVLEQNAHILNISCGDGIYTYAMAAMNPEYDFVGIDRNAKKIEAAKKKYKLPNLSFVAGDVQESFLPPNSLDAIINSFTLHEFYSAEQCSVKAVTDILHRHLELLKEDGYIFIQSYAMQPEDSYVLLEMPDDDKARQEKRLSDAELLVLYADKARADKESQYWGFYLEELPARFPRTRLFRLPHKWAYEFLLRKAKRKEWDEELHKEYTFFSQQEFRETLRRFGTRVLYTSPHWDNQVVQQHFDKKVRLFEESGKPLGTPETSYVVVGQKVCEKRSLKIAERKISHNPNTNLHLSAMRDRTNGTIYDLASRGADLAEVIPYRVTNDGQLHVFVHSGLPRSLMNAVPRSSPNIDGKRWSGHATEAMSFSRDTMDDLRQDHYPSVLKFTREFFGLKPVMGELFAEGPGFYPAPDLIDEHIQTYYLNVEKPDKKLALKKLFIDAEGYSTRGSIREISAQQILDAMSVGFYPTSRLELQIIALYESLGLSYTSWSESPLNIKTEKIDKPTKIQEIIDKMAKADDRFETTNARAGTLKTLQSIFVDEGQNKGGVSGLASREVDFVMTEDETLNVAVVLPLSRKINGEVMAGIVEQYLPVPQRYKGNGYSVNCPSFTLPKEIENIEMARKYIAEKFEVPVDCVARMGESFYSHVGVTPQRIFPFAVTSAGPKGWKKVGRTHGVTTHTPLYNLHRLLYLDNYYSFMKVVAMAYQASLGQDSMLSPDSKMSMSMEASRDPMARFTGESAISMGSSPSSITSKPSEHNLKN